jgi:chromate transporter
MSLLLTPLAWDWPMIANIIGLMTLACLFSFGGAGGPIIVVQNRMVATGLLGAEPFAFVLGLAFMLPGPRAAFVSGVGYYLAGVPGAIAAILGLAIPSLLMSAAASHALLRMQTIVDRARPATGYILAGIIGGTAYSTARPIDIGVLELGAVGIVGYLTAWRDVEPLPVIIVALIIGGARSFIGLQT